MLIKIKVYACYGVKIFKNTTLKNFKQGGRPGVPGAGSAFDLRSENQQGHLSDKQFSEFITFRQ